MNEELNTALYCEPEHCNLYHLCWLCIMHSISSTCIDAGEDHATRRITNLVKIVLGKEEKEKSSVVPMPHLLSQKVAND